MIVLVRSSDRIFDGTAAAISSLPVPLPPGPPPPGFCPAPRISDTFCAIVTASAYFTGMV